MLRSNDTSKGKSERSEGITFRFEKSILDDLRQEAEHKLKSINTLVNQIIKLYVGWYKPSKNTGFGYYDNVLVSYIMNHLTDEEIIQIAEQYCKHRLKDTSFMLNRENTFSSFIDRIISWLEASGFSYKYHNTNVMQTLVIQFDMGRKWSLFFKTYMQQVIDYYKMTEAQCNLTDNIAAIKIKIRS